mgnify:CR=1 FL=1
MINEKIKSLQERRKELENELSLYDLDTTDEEEIQEIESLESQIAEIDAEIKDNKKYFASLDVNELKANMKNAKTEEEYIEAYKEYNEYKAYTGKKSKIRTLVPIFGVAALLVGSSLVGYNITRKPETKSDRVTESSISNNDNISTQHQIKDTTSVSSEQIDEMLSEENSTKTGSTTRTTSTNTTVTTTSTNPVVTTSVPTQEPTTTTRIIINTTETPKKPTTTERTEIIPEVTTTETPTTATTTTEATTTESTTETVIYDTTEEPTTADPYDPDMPIEESNSKKNILSRLKQELLNIKSSRKAIAAQQVYTKILK